MMFTYSERGVVDGYECRHGYPSDACCVIEHPARPPMCPSVGREMLRWYAALPEQSHVRLGKIDFMRRGTLPGWDDSPNRPDLHKLAGL